MDRHISRRVVGALTMAASDIPVDDAVLEGLLHDLFEADISVPEPHTVQDVADALADAMRAPLGQMVVAFCVAFVALAQINDAGVTAMSSEDLLQSIALTWERDG
ncbi:hypothetical protein [Streptacidiphilus sp. PAMC 29251]